MIGDPSARLDSGALPKEACCIRAFDLMDFVLSSLAHYEITPKEEIENWARVFNQVTTDLAYAQKPTRAQTARRTPGPRPGATSV